MQFSCMHVFSIKVENKVDPDQMAASGASQSFQVKINPDSAMVTRQYCGLMLGLVLQLIHVSSD